MGLIVEDRLLRDELRDIGPMGGAGLPDPFENSATVSSMGFNSITIGVVLRKVVLDSELAGVSKRHRGEMYMGGVFPVFLILSSPSMIIPRVFSAFLARATFSSGFHRKSCECLKGIAKSREVPTVLQWTLSKPLSDRTNETWYKKMLTKLILTTLRVVINTPHPEPEL